ncbi:VWA domain-containing protein [Dialister sp.]|jgi:magnesium chelatase subunit D|uniref:VWA domain-containing protein n=1 Tax=Dialister sp. TaxID=1955814 RepID=UPI0025E069BA|nr:VWA domain-containing protein [Dialister sp.]MEE0291521.1 VWA domain-containing protein [Dialister sp.]
MKRNLFPFAAICGMEKAKEAILLTLVNPFAGGLLLSGEKGTGKSTLVRSARELVDAPWVEIPISITEDRLFGSIDTEEAIRSGHKKLLPGLIDEADQGIIYIDDVNLLRDDLLSAVLNIREAGSYRLERDGLSEERQTSFTVLAVMNPESGTLSASSLDRFGLFAEADPSYDDETRLEIIRRVLDFEKDGLAFRAKWQEETDALKKKIRDARAALSLVEVSSAMIQLAAVYTLKAHVAGHRADIYLIEAARAKAALEGRKYVLPKDLEKAAEFVLPHRMRKAEEQQAEPAEEMPQEHPEEDNKPQQEEEQQTPQDNEFSHPPEAQPPQMDTEDADDSNHEQNEDNAQMSNPRGQSRERIDDADLHVNLPPMWIEPSKDRKPKKGSGKRSLTMTDLMQGRYVRAEIPKAKTSDIAFDATLRAAAPYQKARPSNGCAVVIRKDDLRSKIREKRTGNIFLFVVDASGSMGARERMKTVKGVIFKILLDAYQKRDRVGMVAFRKNQAEVLLPVTRSVDFAQKKLASMPTGGKTPLAKGLLKAEDVLDMLYRQDANQDPVMILITDGRATSPLNKGTNPVTDALEEAKRIGRRNIPVAVIDTESGFIKLGLAKKLAKAMGASYFQVDKISEDQLLHIWRTAANM